MGAASASTSGNEVKSVGQRGEDGDRLCPKPGDRLDVGRNHVAWRGSDAHRDPAVDGCGRLAEAERGFRRAPRGHPIDLRAHNAVQELDGAVGKVERLEQKAFGSEHQLDMAPRQECQRARRGDPPVSNADGFALGIGCSIRAQHELAVFVLDQPDDARRRQPPVPSDGGIGHAVDPAREALADHCQRRHRSAVLAAGRTRASSLSSRHDNTEYGSGPSSNGRMTTSKLIRRPLSKAMRIPTRDARLPSVVAWA